MRKTFITFTVAIIMTMSVLTGRSSAVENSARISVEEARKSGAEKKAAEEAKKKIIARVNGAEINMFMLVRSMNRVAPRPTATAPKK